MYIYVENKRAKNLENLTWVTSNERSMYRVDAVSLTDLRDGPAIGFIPSAPTASPTVHLFVSEDKREQSGMWDVAMKLCKFYGGLVHAQRLPEFMSDAYDAYDPSEPKSTSQILHEVAQKDYSTPEPFKEDDDYASTET